MKKILIFYIFFSLLLPFSAEADYLDSDNDGLSDEEELIIYHTDPQKADTDGDGYVDGEEVKNDYTPLNSAKTKIFEADFDNDGLTDGLEIKFGSNIIVADTDNDGYSDGFEIKNAYTPTSTEKIKLPKKIEVNLKKQELSYFLGGIKLGQYPVSSGVNNSTPKGEVKVVNKNIKAWSSYGLWMPYWLGLKNGKFGIHELPVWPNGHREGEKSLGHPASHGCIRLGMGPAKIIYDWAEVGTPVVIN